MMRESSASERPGQGSTRPATSKRGAADVVTNLAVVPAARPNRSLPKEWELFGGISVLPGEKPEDLLTIYDRFAEVCAPADLLEHALVYDIVRALWTMRRTRQAVDKLLLQLIKEEAAAAETDHVMRMIALRISEMHQAGDDESELLQEFTRFQDLRARLAERDPRALIELQDQQSSLHIVPRGISADDPEVIAKAQLKLEPYERLLASSEAGFQAAVRNFDRYREGRDRREFIKISTKLKYQSLVGKRDVAGDE